MDEREFLTSQEAEEFLLHRLRADDNERSALVQIAGETDLIERHAIRGAAPPGGAPAMITKFFHVHLQNLAGAAVTIYAKGGCQRIVTEHLNLSIVHRFGVAVVPEHSLIVQAQQEQRCCLA